MTVSFFSKCGGSLVILTINNTNNSPWQDKYHDVSSFVFRVSPQSLPEHQVKRPGNSDHKGVKHLENKSTVKPVLSDHGTHY